MRNEISNLLETFVSLNRCFTLQEVEERSEMLIEPSVLIQSISNDSRFILAGKSRLGLECFLPERTMFQWWSSLNLRLASINQVQLTEHQLAIAMRSLSPRNLWSAPPAPMLDYGYRWGFVAPAWSKGLHAFPLASLAAHTSPLVRHLMGFIFRKWSLSSDGERASALPVKELVDSVLECLRERSRYIIKVREGLPPYEKMTLRRLGECLDITFERVRQIESKSWRKMLNLPNREMSIFIAIILSEIMQRKGSLILSTKDTDVQYICFAARCLGIPFSHFESGDSVVLGVTDANLLSFWREGFSSLSQYTDNLVRSIELAGLSFLGRQDIEQIAAVFQNHKIGKLTKQEKVYLALNHIRRSAHYSEITTVYNELFPDDSMIERNILATLARCAEPDVERFGIVWLGIHGRYGLKEHGYERPSNSHRWDEAIKKFQAEHSSDS